MKDRNVRNNKQSSLRVDMTQEMKERLEDYLKPRGLKKAWFIRKAILDALDREESREATHEAK